MAHQRQLDGPLDVGQPAVAELEVEPAVVPGPDALLLQPHPHPPDVGDLFERQDLRIREVGGVGQEPASQGFVPPDEPGTEERLVLPGLRPSLPVLQVGGHGSGQRARTAFRTEVGVGLPARLPDAGQDPFRRGGRGGEVIGAVALVDEHQVQIRAEAQLFPAQLAQAHHRQWQRGPIGCHGQGDDRIGHARQPAAGLRHAEFAGGVRPGHPDHLGLRVRGEQRWVVRWRGQEGCGQLGPRHQGVGEGRAHAHHGRQAAGRVGTIGQGVGQGVACS